MAASACRASATERQLAEFRARFTDVVGLESEVATLRVIAARVPAIPTEEAGLVRVAAILLMVVFAVVLLGVSSALRQVVIGLVLIAAVGLDVVYNRRRR